MTKRQRSEYIADRLEQLFPDTPVPLDHTDPYTLLVAVLLSAQCTDIRVNKVTPGLFKLASTPAKMAKLTIEQINGHVRPCGLAPTKAKNIKRLSQILVDEFGSKVPCDWEALESLPGVGHKTASVVMSQAFKQPAFPVDTHIHRIAQMWKLTDGSSVKRTEKDLKECFPKDLWNKLHLQIIFYGREYCSARGCNGLRCQICQHCFPSRKKPIERKKP